jgi:hypothetical protein
MATFLPNVTDVFPKSSEYTPDWDRVERSLKLRHQMYDEGANRIKTMYDSLFNSQMMRSQNIEARDSYLKTITDSLNRISSMDLSLPQNQENANELFTPIINDRSLVKDISFTKQYQNELSNAESLKKSSDPAVYKTYWDVGIKALQYKAEEFKNADAETALGMSAPTYVPNVDLLGVADKAYKDFGISVKQDEISGAYIWTKKNGDAVFPVSKNFVETLFSSDPRIKDMLLTQAYVERKDFVKQNAVKYGGEQQAESFYLQEMIKNGSKTAQTKIDNSTSELKQLRTKKDSWDKVIRERGIVPGSAEHEDYLNDLEKLKIAEEGVVSQTDSILPSQFVDYNNIEELRAQADNLVLFSNYTILTNQIASLLAYRDAEATVKVNPISLAQLNADLSLKTQSIMESIKQANRREMEDIKQENRDKTEETRQENRIETIQERNKNKGGGGKSGGKGGGKDKGKTKKTRLTLDDLTLDDGLDGGGKSEAQKDLEGM